MGLFTQVDRQRDILYMERLAEIVHGVQAERSTIYVAYNEYLLNNCKEKFKYSEYNQKPSPFYYLAILDYTKVFRRTYCSRYSVAVAPLEWFVFLLLQRLVSNTRGIYDAPHPLPSPYSVASPW
jgi:hypothetical protein